MKGSVENASSSRRLRHGNQKTQANTKKPFDKKKYRQQKYSNKYKINQWEDRRKKAILRDYYKERDKSQRQHPEELVSLKSVDDENNQSNTHRLSAFHKAKQEFLRKKNEKKKSQEDAMRVKSEREEALKKYKDKRMQTYKRLSKKTRKGQPVMKDRLEMLLEKIQRQV